METDVLQRALDREKARRLNAEKLLEDKSLELYLSYESLKESHEQLSTALEEVKRKQHQLVQSEKMASLGVMSAGVAHEINNPLAFVFSNVNSLEHAVTQFVKYNGHVKALLDAKTNTESKSNLETLSNFARDSDLDYLFEDCVELIAETKDGISRVKSIVSGLQSFARTDSDNMETVDVHECIKNTLKLAHSQIKYSATVIEDFGELPEIRGYPGKLGQVILNLIVNAIHAMGDAQGQITVTTRLQDSHVTIAVTDTGCGMTQETIDNIFMPFFTTKEVGKGTGLGLAISHGIIEEHRGSITVESKVDMGTTFTLTLPIDPEQINEIQAAA